MWLEPARRFRAGYIGWVPPLPSVVRDDLDRSGYYPQLVTDALDVAVAGEAVVEHLVQTEAAFDSGEVRRHMTALVLTPTRLIITHVDDHPADSLNPARQALATTEAIPLARITTVAVTIGVLDPASYTVGSTPAEVTIGIDWGSRARVELEPAICGDPTCNADHGYSGVLEPNDLLVRLSTAADGPEAVRAGVRFARAVSALCAR